MNRKSAGLLLYRHAPDGALVLLVHPGGPFWRRRDAGAWSIPKGAIETGETPEAAARREFEEEVGPCPPGPLEPLGALRQKGGKWVEAFALEGLFDVAAIRGGRFEMEWPPKSGRMEAFPEVDRAEWLTLAQARGKILPSQNPFLDRLEERLRSEGEALDPPQGTPPPDRA